MILVGWLVQFASIRAARRVQTLVAVRHCPFFPASGASPVEFTVKVTAGAAAEVGARVKLPATAASAAADRLTSTRVERRGEDSDM
ncbi:MAG: hypothetical protein IPH03_14120 [Tetrasphaera sp.]|nr:hypothetical protein [Tetrasphaera sp.]